MGTEMFKDVCSQYFTKSWYTEIYMDIHVWGLQRMGPKRWVHSGSDYLVDARGHQRGMEKLISECSAAENHTGHRTSPNLNHQWSDEGLLVWRVLIPAVTFSINNSGCCWRNAWRDIVSAHCWPFSTNWATLRYNSVLTAPPSLWDHSWPIFWCTPPVEWHAMSQSFNLEHLLDFNWGHSHQISIYKRRLAVWWDGRLTSADLTKPHKLCDSITSVWTKISEESFQQIIRHNSKWNEGNCETIMYFVWASCAGFSSQWALYCVLTFYCC